MIRHRTYPIEDVLKHVQFTPKSSGPNSSIKSGKRNKVEFDGELINMSSDRYKLFATKGCKCVACGIEGEFFALERHETDMGYHFNLYAIKDGMEVLMTKDHIVPKAVGGLSKLSNYQPMCVTCNGEKRHGPPGLTLEAWQDIPISTLKVGAIPLILADWKRAEAELWEDIRDLDSELRCSSTE